MSLLDDVSIVVTPNGYKAGELYAVIPVPTEGTEKIDNGTFTTADLSDFATTYATQEIVSEELKTTLNTANGYGFSKFTFAAEIGRSYRILASCKQGTSDGTQVRSNSGITLINSGTNTGDWNYDEIGVATSTTCQVRLQAYGASGVYGLFDNVSVKEYTSADMDVTRATDATRVNESGLIEDVLSNVPRIDYTGGGCPHILAEPMRTNLVTYSEDFSQTKWTGSPTTADVTVTTNTNPSGASGTYSVENVTGTQLGSFYTITSGVDYTNSFYVRNISGSGVISLKDINNSGTEFTATSEWQKFSVTGTSNSTTGRIYLSVTTVGDIVEVWGAQLEEGSYATSYIPTSGSTVTRNQDIFTRDGIGSLINSTEGVLFVEMAALADDGVAKYLTMNDGSSNNDVRIYFNTASNGISALLKSTTGATQAFLSYTVTDTTAFHKIAFVYAVNRFELWVDGEKRAEDLSGIAPVGLTTLEFSRASNFLPFFGKVKQLQVYNTALTPTQLDALTS